MSQHIGFGVLTPSKQEYLGLTAGKHPRFALSLCLRVNDTEHVLPVLFRHGNDTVRRCRLQDVLVSGRNVYTNAAGHLLRLRDGIGYHLRSKNNGRSSASSSSPVHGLHDGNVARHAVGTNVPGTALRVDGTYTPMYGWRPDNGKVYLSLKHDTRYYFHVPFGFELASVSASLQLKNNSIDLTVDGDGPVGATATPTSANSGTSKRNKRKAASLAAPSTSVPKAPQVSSGGAAAATGHPNIPDTTASTTANRASKRRKAEPSGLVRGLAKMLQTQPVMMLEGTKPKPRLTRAASRARQLNIAPLRRLRSGEGAPMCPMTPTDSDLGNDEHTANSGEVSKVVQTATAKSAKKETVATSTDASGPPAPPRMPSSIKRHMAGLMSLGSWDEPTATGDHATQGNSAAGTFGGDGHATEDDVVDRQDPAYIADKKFVRQLSDLGPGLPRVTSVELLDLFPDSASPSRQNSREIAMQVSAPEPPPLGTRPRRGQATSTS